MIGSGICALFGLACASAQVPPAPPSIDIAAPVVAAPVVDVPPVVDLDVRVPDAFPATCPVQPPPDLRKHFVAAARKHPGATTCELAKQAWCESRFIVDAVSPAGAIGVSQFVPLTAAELDIDPWDPRESIFGQARYINWLRAGWTPPAFADRTRQDIEGLGLGSYNFGRGAMYRDQERNGWNVLVEAMPHLPSETQGYIACAIRGHR